MAQVVQLICENYSVDEVMASREFYESNVYSLLEQEKTKLWHFSPLTMFNMYDKEKRQETLRCILALKPCIPPGLIILWRTSISILRQGNQRWFKAAA